MGDVLGAVCRCSDPAWTHTTGLHDLVAEKRAELADDPAPPEPDEAEVAALDGAKVEWGIQPPAHVSAEVRPWSTEAAARARLAALPGGIFHLVSRRVTDWQVTE